MPALLVIDLGRRAYAPTLDLQQRLIEVVGDADDERACLVLVEHDPPVITLGRRGDDRHLLATPKQLAAAGVELHHASRGGDVTCHGPGQLVAYPILRLDLHGRDVRKYLRSLEAALIATLKRFGVEGRREQGLTGVWVGDEKVAAIGVAVKRWVTWHGAALNVATDLRHFDLIVPCGIRGRGVTSLSRLLGRDVSTDEVKPHLIECMAEQFGFDEVRQLRPEDAGL